MEDARNVIRKEHDTRKSFWERYVARTGKVSLREMSKRHFEKYTFSIVWSLV